MFWLLTSLKLKGTDPKLDWKVLGQLVDLHVSKTLPISSSVLTNLGIDVVTMKI
jgi:hypothetical protein